MPPEGFTTITISEETADKLAEIVVNNELESITEAVEYAADVARDPESLSDAELAHLLYRRLTN